MKKILFVIFSIMSIISYGQNEKNEITLQKGIHIYCISNPTINFQKRQYATYGAMIETVNNTNKWYIIKYINVGDKLTRYYNAIVISKNKKIKDKVYVVLYDDLGDNKYLIDDINKKLKEKYDVIDNELCSLNDSLIFVKEKYINDTLTNNIKYMNKSSEYIKYYGKIKEKMTDSLVFIYQSQKEKLYNELSIKLKSFTKHINITYSELGYPNSAGGCDVHFSYINTSNKIIKYLYFKPEFYNNVDDKVSCEIRGFNFTTCEDVGKIDHGCSGGGTWENLIYNYSARYVVIKSIKILYTDNTAYTINLTKDEYKKIMTYFDFINTSEKKIKEYIKDFGVDDYLKDKLENLKSINKEKNYVAYKKYVIDVNRLNSKLSKIKNNNDIFYEFNVKECMLYWSKIKV